MDSQERATQQLRDMLKECFVQVRFARAAELARSGRHLEAEGLLSPNGQEPTDPKELDLLARIFVRQRRYRCARRLWEIALMRSPGKADYERAIERTRDAERFEAMLRKGAMLALLGLAVTTMIIAVWSSFHRHSPSASWGGKKRPDIHTKAIPLSSSSPQLTQPAGVKPRPEPAKDIQQPAPATPQPAPSTATSPVAPGKE
jgi:hypothetical protein